MMSAQEKRDLYQQLEAEIERAHELALQIVEHAKTKNLQEAA